MAADAQTLYESALWGVQVPGLGIWGDSPYPHIVTVQQTITGVARIRVTVQQTIMGRARIVGSTSNRDIRANPALRNPINDDHDLGVPLDRPALKNIETNL